jgi:phage gp29-like protein
MRSESNGQGTFSTPLTRLAPSVPSGGPKLVDPYGRPLTPDDAAAYGPPTEPVRDAATAGVIKRDIPINLVTRWDSESVGQALDEHMYGSFRQSAFLCDAITGDDRVSATLGQRMGALFSRPMKTVPCLNGVETDDAEAVEVAQAWDAAWDKFAPLSVLEEIQSWGVLEAAVPVELQWDTTVTPWQPYLKPWHPTHLMWRWDLRKYTIVTMDGIEVIEPGDGRWMLYTPHGPYRGWRRAGVRPIATPWLVRQMSWRDHARYNERHGMPIMKAKAPARSDPNLRDRWIAGLSNLGQEAVVLCPQNVDGTGFDIEMLEAKDRTYESFGALAGRADMAIVLTILWQNLTTEVNGGAYAAAVVHEGVQQSGARFDNGTLSHWIYEQAAPVFAEWNFGRRELAPKRHWVIDTPADHLTSAQAFQAFSAAIANMKNAGIKITLDGVAALAFAFNLPLTREQIQEVAVTEATPAGGAP